MCEGGSISINIGAMYFAYDVVIIGGGPAGSIAAIYLNNNGFDVCIIEKAVFPRETLCGEFLSVEVSRVLKELDLFKGFLKLSPNSIDSFRFINNNGKEVFSGFNFTAYGLKRSIFDHFLLSRAIETGSSVIQPAEVKSIKKNDDLFVLAIKDESGKVFNLYSRDVIAAYGKQNIIDKQLNRKFVNYRSRLNGVKFHLGDFFINKFNKNEICIYAADGIYCGVNAVNDNTITLCFLEDRNKIKSAPRLQVQRLIENNKPFSTIFNCDIEKILHALPLYGTGNLFFGKKEKVVNGIFMIGDAAGVIAPLAGDGIGMAFESAKLISEILIKKRNGYITSDQAMIDYEIEWERRFKNRLKSALLIQNFVLNKPLRNIGINAVKIFPFMTNNFIKSTRSME